MLSFLSLTYLYRHTSQEMYDKDGRGVVVSWTTARVSPGAAVCTDFLAGRQRRAPTTAAQTARHQGGHAAKWGVSWFAVSLGEAAPSGGAIRFGMSR
jgi:hypothetical protein